MKVIKLDIDYKMEKELLKEFIETRIILLKHLGYNVIDYNYRKTKHGYHFWFIVDKDIEDKRLAEIQFLLGDDIRRAKFNFFRAKHNVFKHFNILFSLKEYKHKQKYKYLKYNDGSAFLAGNKCLDCELEHL